jgi:hypothetical protein
MDANVEGEGMGCGGKEGAYGIWKMASRIKERAKRINS